MKVRVEVKAKVRMKVWVRVTHVRNESDRNLTNNGPIRDRGGLLGLRVKG